MTTTTSQRPGAVRPDPLQDLRRAAESLLAALLTTPAPAPLRPGVDEHARVLVHALRPLLTALGPAPARPREPPAPGTTLTAREREVLRHVGTGLTADAVAHRLRISAGTVRKHLENAYRKLDCGDRLVAVQRARERGLIPSARALG